MPSRATMNRFVEHLAGAAMLCLACWGNAHAQPPSAAAQAVRPLLDHQGDLASAEPGAIPASPDHRTRAGLYATQAQACALQAALGQRLIAVRVGCCGVPGMDAAVHRVREAQVAEGFPPTVPVLVFGDDMWHAAQVVDRLTDLGLARVFLVRVP